VSRALPSKAEHIGVPITVSPREPVLEEFLPDTHTGPHHGFSNNSYPFWKYCLKQPKIHIRENVAVPGAAGRSRNDETGNTLQGRFIMLYITVNISQQQSGDHIMDVVNERGGEM
jgi:hypothetical protein